MDPNKLYCRNVPQSASSTSSISSATSSTLGYGDGSTQNYMNCNSAGYSAGGFSCKELLSRNVNSKSSVSHRATNNGSVYGGGYCGSNTSASGNCVNVMSVPVGTLPYHRRKLTPQEYQSRMYYNTTDLKCREDYYAMTGGGGGGGGSRMNTSSPLPSLQIQNQHHQQLQSHQLSNQYGQSHNTNTCSSSAQCMDPIEDTINCGRVVVGTQTQLNSISNSNVDQGQGAQAAVSSPISLSAVNMPGPLMYTVHRVVTTAQIQTAMGNTFTSSSSISSIVSGVRSDAECTSGLVAGSKSNGCHINAGHVAASLNTINVIGDGSSNGNGKNNTIISNNGNRGNVNTSSSSSGVNMNANYNQGQQQTNSINGLSEMQQHSSGKLNNGKNCNSVSGNGGKQMASSVPRRLQNVIPTCVYLMSRIAVHMEIEGTAQCPSQVMLAAALGCEELGISNKLLAQSIFGLWMSSALLEIQLKSHHRPYLLRVAWSSLLEKFSHGNPIEKKFDEPMIVLKRNVFFSKRDEEKIKDHRILELLYEEAKHNVLLGRYVMEPVHSLMLGGIQARIELGPYNAHTHTISFFRENQSRFLPQHVAKNSSWSWLPVSRKNSAEVKLLEQFKRVPQTATTRKLMRKYLEFCWALPFYGAAFFHGQVEQSVRGLMSLVNHKDTDVIVAINERGVFIIDPIESTLLLGLKYEDLSWDFAKPSASDDPECLNCIFLQFDAVENGIQVSKLMQVFSKQAFMIDALILHFTELIKKRKQQQNTTEQFHEEPNPIQNNGNGVLCNKLSRLTLATFDEEGRCVGQMGSLSISF